MASPHKLPHALLRKLAIGTLAVSLSVFGTTPGLASCGTGNPLSYDDITGIQFEQSNCGGLDPPELRRTCFSYSMFVSNWDHHQDEVREFEQYAPAGIAGDYTLDVSPSELIAILKQRKFFELNPASIAETDVTYSVLTASIVASLRDYHCRPNAHRGPS